MVRIRIFLNFVSNNMVFKLDEVVWGDAFDLGREVVDGELPRR